MKIAFLSIALIIWHSLMFGQSITEKPNIIVIMTDDMGYSDIGCYGSEIETPHLDSLTKQGLRFSQFYNTGRCCPYSGKWEVPAEGLVIYDWYTKKGQKLEGDYKINIAGFGDKLLHISPVKNG